MPAPRSATPPSLRESQPPDPRYAALVARDARFDGRLFIGVSSTGIYCRPVCRVRTPAQRHCRFFGRAAEAEAAGFRPCLRCRPELAPGLSRVDSPQALGAAAATLIETAVSQGQALTMAGLAARLGVTDRHLRRVFTASMGVSPKAYLDTQRLLLAKQLLTDSTLPVTEVAQAAGFASLRRFNAAFLQQYRMSPGTLRGRKKARGAQGAQGVQVGADQPGNRPSGAGQNRLRDAEVLTCHLGYRPPYDIEGMLRFLRDRAIAGVETVDGLQWRRTLAWPGRDGQAPSTGWIGARFDPARHEVEVTVCAALQRATGALLPLVRQALDLNADPSRIDPVLADLPGASRPGIRVPGGMEGFETAARVILGQQVTVAAARTLTTRLVQALGSPVETPYAGLTRLFPRAQQVASADAQDLGRLGIVRQRVGALQAVAQAVARGHLRLDRSAALEPTLDALRALPGIGEWTVQLIAMRALAWPDALPVTDVALLNALGTRDTRAVTQRAQAWQPWRAYAVMALWQSLLKPEAA